MRPSARRLAAAVALAAAAVSSSRGAQAKPQVGVAVTTGLALTDLRTNGPRLAYHLGGRADALFLRERPTSMGVGPYVEVLTTAFDTLEAGGGVSWLVPAGAPAFVFSGGGFARSSALGWEPGAAAKVYWGARSFNYHGPYGLAVGLFVQGREAFGPSHALDVLGGVELDVAYLALPFLYAIEAVRR